MRDGLGAFLIYLGLALIFFGRGLIGHFSDYYIGREADPSVMMWLLKWWPYAVSHRLNPFLTDFVWAPVGFNFAWMTSIPLPALIAAPLSATIGLVATYNVLTLLSAPTAALCAYALCRRLSKSFWPAMIGGFIFGFSAFMNSQTLGHLCLILSFPLPLAAYLVARRMDDSLGPRWFMVWMAVALISEFLIDLEMFATATIVGVVALALGYRYSSALMRARLLKLLPGFAAAFTITVMVVSPYLYYFLGFEGLHQPLWPSERFSTDLLNFIVPTPAALVGMLPPLAALSARFTGTMMERNGFIALPVLIVTWAWARRHWREPLCKVLLLSTIIVLVCAIGPYLQVGGFPTLPMPWLAFSHLPLLEHALPSRLMVFPPLAVGMIVSLWLVDPGSRREAKLIAVVTTIVLMLPNPRAGFWSSRIRTPQFFSDGLAQKSLTRQDVVLTLPWGIEGHSMDWQAECDMCFRNVAGWTGVARFEVRRWPIVNYFLGSRDLDEPELQLKAFLANNGVTAIVIDDENSSAAPWRTVVDSLGVEPNRISGVSLYRLDPLRLAEYRAPEYSGVEMERRAIQSRFATLIAAADKYLESGHDPTRLSDSELVHLGLLPPDWNREPNAFTDKSVQPWGHSGAVIVGLGSKAGLSATMAQFHDSANVVYLPYPHILAGTDPINPLVVKIHNAIMPRASMPIDGESMEYLGVAFDRARLHRAAERVAQAKPSASPLLSLMRP